MIGIGQDNRHPDRVRPLRGNNEKRIGEEKRARIKNFYGYFFNPKLIEINKRERYFAQKMLEHYPNNSPRFFRNLMSFFAL